MKPLSSYHPVLYFLSVWEKRGRRYLRWYFGKNKYVSGFSQEKLEYRVKKHQSVLIRKNPGAELQWQVNKIENLKIAVRQISGVIIYPGETFSFCKLVGLPTRRRGFMEGMELSFGEARAGIGGGLCQASNLIHWLVIHSDLTVTERHHHSFDPFPDDGRVLPFGSGATVFYNYRDYAFRNDTPWTYQLNLWMSEKCLEGELRINMELDHAYHVYEQEHEFYLLNGKFYRKNEIWRNCIAKYRQGAILKSSLITRNFAEVKYKPESFREVETKDLSEDQKLKIAG